MRVALLLVAFLLAPLASAQEGEDANLAPLLPRAPRVVDVAADAPTTLTLSLHNETSGGVLLVVIGDSLVAGDEAQVALDDASPPTTWSRTREPATLQAHPVVLRDGRSMLNASLSAEEDARVLLYYDVSCNCSNKTAPFPGALLAFHVDADQGDAITAKVSAPSGVRFRAEAVKEDAADKPDATNGSAAGELTLTWSADGGGRAFLLVTVLEGVGTVEVAFERTPGESARTPSSAWVCLLALGVGAWVGHRRKA